MRRRDFIMLFSGAAAMWPLAAYSQPRLPRVGVLFYTRALPPTDLPIAHELARLGYVDGRNITYVVRAAESDVSRMPHLARELVAEKPDVIVACVYRKAHPKLCGGESANLARRMIEVICNRRLVA